MAGAKSQRGGSAVIVQRVRPGCEAAYREWSHKINKVCSQFPGFSDIEVFEPAQGLEQSFVIVVRFDSAEESSAWHSSAVCRELLEQADPLLEEAVMHSPSQVFSGWFGGPGAARSGRQSAWKEALVVLFVLYPTVMLLSTFVTGPLLHTWSRSTAIYVGNLLSVALMTWLLMPAVTNWLSFWLDPKTSTTTSAKAKGLAVVLGGQLLMVVIFHHFLNS